MVPYLILAAAVCLAVLRVWQRHRRAATPETTAATGSTPLSDRLHSDVALVAIREIRERTRGRVFRVGTIIILLAVAAGIVIPALQHGSSGSSSERVAVVGAVSAPLRTSIVRLGPAVGASVRVKTEPDLATARHDLAAGHIDIVLNGTTGILVDTTPNADDSSTTTQLAQAMALTVSLQTSLQANGLSAQKAAALTHPTPLPITGLHPAKTQSAHPVTIYGLILLFVLLSQYGTWILLGVVEEKSSRVVEVLLATLRPRQLLAGKVLGIGLVALIQAALLLAVALGLGAAVGSDLLKGDNPTNVLATVIWLVLGYIFYCWVYAAAGSLATRQEHIQTLAFPLQLPLLLGYITSLTAISSSSASTFVHVLAYLPPTAPFAMPVLVALGEVMWWQFAIAVVLSLAATVAIARLAAAVYVRAILRTGQRVRLRDIARSDATPRRAAAT